MPVREISDDSWESPLKTFLLRTGGTTGTATSGKPKKVDDDPDGEKLLWGAPRHTKCCSGFGVLWQLWRWDPRQQDFMEQASKIVRNSQELEGSRDVKEQRLPEVRTMVTYSGLDSATHVREAPGLDR